MSDNEEYAAGDAGSADFIPSSAGDVKKGGYCMLKGFPCKVTEYSTAKPGKHGSAKATIVGLDIFTNKKYEDSWPTSAGVRIPIVTKKEYEVADINEDDMFVSLIQDDGSLKTDLKLPKEEELQAELLKLWRDNNENGQVFYSVISACGQDKIVTGRCKE